MKKRILFTILAVFAVLAAVPFVAHAHGGGCRKANLPQCCHMDSRTGIVHCH